MNGKKRKEPEGKERGKKLEIRNTGSHSVE